MLRTALFAAATAASVSLPAVPAAAHSTDSHTELNPVVITATGSELRRSQVAPATHIINRAEIERAQATDLGELLRFVAGIDVARSGGPGGQTSVFIRGGESDHTLVLLDGTPINDGVNGLAPFPVIEPAMIERIEIIKGPRASLYGRAGLAGVINVITRNAEDQSLSINSRVGADNTRDLGARASWHGASGDSLTVQFQRRSTDGIPPFTSSTEDRGLRRNTLQISGRVPRGNWALDAKLWRSQSELEYDSGFSSPSYRSQQSRNRAVQLGLGGAVTANWSTRLALHDLDDELDQDQSSNFSHTRRSTLQWTNQLEISDQQQLGLNANVSQDDLAGNIGGSDIEEQRRNSSANLQWQLLTGGHQLQAQLTGIDHDSFGGHTVWNLDYGYAFSANWRAVAVLGTGFRAPTLIERSGFGFGPSSFNGNPDLQPERSENVEVGLIWLPGTQTRLELRVFRNDVEDAILLQFDPSTFSSTPVNVPGTRTVGTEISAQTAWRQWQLRATTNFQDPEDSNNGQTLLRRSRKSAGLNLTRAIGVHRLGLDLRASGARPDVDPATFGRTQRGGYAVLNLTGVAQQTANCSLSARVENLLDKDYETVAGYRQPGFTPYLSLNWQL